MLLLEQTVTEIIYLFIYWIYLLKPCFQEERKGAESHRENTAYSTGRCEGEFHMTGRRILLPSGQNLSFPLSLRRANGPTGKAIYSNSYQVSLIATTSYD